MAKLYRYTSSNFQLFSSLQPGGEVCLGTKEKLLTMFWPDGSWCFQANAYVINLKLNGRSRTTIFQYCTQISHLIRYCFHNKLRFHEISNSSFTMFMNGIKSATTDIGNTKLRTANATIAIGRRCLDFIQFVGQLHGLEGLVGPNGLIQADKKEHYIATNGFKPKIVRFWHHDSFPLPSPKKKGNAISKVLIEALKNAVALSSASAFLKKRRYITLLLLEITGGRRTEVSNLTVESVRRAMSDPDHQLELITLKIPGAVKTRLIPISEYDCKFLIEFIEKNRAPLISKTCGISNDEGFVLTSFITGKKLAENTITQELALLKKIAKIKNKAHPHMFRHRFITKLYVTLIARYNIQNEGDFRKRIIDADHIKREIAEYTGHRRLESLDVYIKPALDEYYGVTKALTSIQQQTSFEGLGRALADIEESIKNNTPNPVLVDKISTLNQTFKSIEISGLHKPSPSD